LGDDSLSAVDYHSKEALTRQRLLAHARIDLQRALILEHLEMETRLRALLALAQVSFLQHKQEEAEVLLAQVRAETRDYELVQIEIEINKLLEQMNENS
jgi:hypothetical protein